MAVTASMYGRSLQHFAAGGIDWTSGSVKVRLLDGTYTFDQDAHEFASSLTGELSTGNGYTSGGLTLASRSVGTYDAANNRTPLLAGNSVWTPAAGQTLTAYHAVVLLDTGTAGTSPLIAYVDFGGAVSATGADFTIAWDATNGVCYLQAS